MNRAIRLARSKRIYSLLTNKIDKLNFSLVSSNMNQSVIEVFEATLALDKELLVQIENDISLDEAYLSLELEDGLNKNKIASKEKRDEVDSIFDDLKKDETLMGRWLVPGTKVYLYTRYFNGDFEYYSYAQKRWVYTYPHYEYTYELATSDQTKELNEVIAKNEQA